MGESSAFPVLLFPALHVFPVKLPRPELRELPTALPPVAVFHVVSHDGSGSPRKVAVHPCSSPCVSYRARLLASPAADGQHRGPGGLPGFRGPATLPLAPAGRAQGRPSGEFGRAVSSQRRERPLSGPLNLNRKFSRRWGWTRAVFSVRGGGSICALSFRRSEARVIQSLGAALPWDGCMENWAICQHPVDAAD